MTDQKYWEEFWRARIKVKRLHGWDGTWGPHGAFLGLLRRHHGDVRGQRVIEIGGAYSLRLLSLAKYGGARATALDFAENGLRATAALFRANGCKVESVLADVFAWQPEERFDVACHWGVLEHFTEPAKLLRASRELVRPGGAVIFSMPNLAAYGARWWQEYAPQNYRTHVYHPEEAIAAACTEAGLELRARYHWGVPLAQIAPWERGPVWLQALTAVNLGALALGRLLPVWRWGHPRVSMERGFVAVRTEATPD